MFFHQLRCDECMWKSKTHTHSTSAARKVKKTDEQNQLNRVDGGRKKFRNHSKIERTRLAAFGFGAHIRSSKDRQTLFQYCDTEKASFAVFFANHSALSHISFTGYGIDVAAGFFFSRNVWVQYTCIYSHRWMHLIASSLPTLKQKKDYHQSIWNVCLQAWK